MSAASDSRGPSAAAWRYSVAFVALAWTLEVYAIWSRTYVPLVDLPNHMARHYLEARWLSGTRSAVPEPSSQPPFSPRCSGEGAATAW